MILTSVLSQTLPAGAEVHWSFWLTLVGILIQGVFTPIIGGLLAAIFGRLRDGDKTLKKQDQSLARLETKTERIEQDIEETKLDLKAAGKDAAALEVEAGGSVKELRVEIERAFVRKEDFNRYCERSDRQHNEVMEALRDMKSGGRR